MIGSSSDAVAVPPVPAPTQFVPSHPPASNIPYLIAVVAMTLLGVTSTVAVLVIRPQADNAALFAAIAGFIAPTTMALLAFMKTQETHVLVDGRMDEFKRLLELNAAQAEENARQHGRAEGKAKEATDASARASASASAEPI